MKTRPEHFSLWQYLLFIAVLAAVMCLCVCVGSVNIALADTLTVFRNALTRTPQPEGLPSSILLTVRLPRVLCVALSGAALSLAGASMQGLLKIHWQTARRSASRRELRSVRCWPLRLASRFRGFRLPERWSWR